MGHTVVRLTNAEITSQAKADELKQTIKTELDNRGYDLTDRSVGDGTNIDGDILLRASTTHGSVTEADSWTYYLRQLMKNNLAADASDGEGVVSAVVDEHDCQHLEGKEQPCKPVEWQIG